MKKSIRQAPRPNHNPISKASVLILLGGLTLAAIFLAAVALQVF